VAASNIEQLRQDWHHAQNFIASRKKFFIVGSPKSGTTWLLNLLNGHHEIVVNGEGRFTWRLVPWLAQAVKAFNDDQAKFVGKEVTYLRDVDLQMASRMFIDIQLCRYIETSGKPLFSVAAVGDKTPQHAMSMPLLSQFYPDAQFLHIVRDPRDAAVSGWHHFGPDSQKEQQDYLAYSSARSGPRPSPQPATPVGSSEKNTTSKSATKISTPTNPHTSPDASISSESIPPPQTSKRA